MIGYEEGILYWFINKKNQSDVIGLIRDYNDGCFIVGGLTGSHWTGHGEDWRNKKREMLSQGYINSELAIKRRIVPGNWKFPKVNWHDQRTIDSLSLRENENLYSTKRKWILIRDVADSLKTTLSFTQKMFKQCKVRTKVVKYKGGFYKLVNVADMKLSLMR